MAGSLDDTFDWLDGGMRLAVAADEATRLSDVYGALAGVACTLTGYRGAAVYLLDPDRVLRVRGWAGAGQRLVRSINEQRPISAEDAGGHPGVRALLGREPVAVADVLEDHGCAPWAPVLAAEGVRSLLCTPLVAGGRVLGVLECHTDRPHRPEPKEIALLERLARIGGFAIDMVRRRLDDEQRILELEDANRKLVLQGQWLERAQTTEARLMQVLLEDRSLDGLAAVLATSLDCTALVEEVGLLPHAALAGEHLVPEAAAALAAGEVSARGQRPHPAGRLTVISNDPVTGMPGGLAAPALLAGELTGWVSAYRAQAFDRFERRTIERAAVVMAALAQRQRAEREVEWRLSREFFDQLLETGAGTATGPIVDRGLHLGIDLTQPNVILVFRGERVPDGTDPAEAADARNTRLISSVQRAVDASSARGTTVARADHVVVLYPARPEAEVERLIARLRDEMRALRLLERMTIAVSSVCREPADYEPTYRAALTAMSLGRPAAEGRVIRVPELGVYTLLLNTRRPEELAEFAATTLAGLRRYDAENNTELVRTLRTYLAERGKLPATAARLFVHPNTVSYRLNRIRDITGGHPNDLDFGLRFELAFMIERLVGAEPSAG